MKQVKLSVFRKKINDKIKKVARIEAENIANNALKITKDEMIHGKKTGNLITKKYIKFRYRRSALGEVIGREPNSIRSRKSDIGTYRGLKSDVTFLRSDSNNKTINFNISLKDTSERAKYKSEYLKNGKKIYVSNKRDLFKNRDNKGYLINGRTSYGYGLYNAIKKFNEEKKLSNASIITLKNW